MTATQSRKLYTTLEGFAECLVARRRVQAVMRPHHDRESRGRLVREYLPALRALDAGALDAAIAAVEERLERGYALTDDPPFLDDAGRVCVRYVHEGQRADDLAVALLEEYETLVDARNLTAPAGTMANTTVYWMDRVNSACRNSS